MSTPKNDRQLEEQVLTLLDQDVQNLDRDILLRLASARKKALAGRGQTRRFRHVRSFRLWLPAAALSMAAAALMLFFAGHDPVTLPQMGPDPVEMDIMASQESLDLFEDLDFYLWLAAEQMNAG